jgi:proline iminopeptidase
MVTSSRPLARHAALAALLMAGCGSVDDPGALVPPTAEQDPALPQVRLTVAGRARAVHLQTFGASDRPTLLFLHGSYGDFRAFLPFQVLADRYQVVLWDQRGAGLSERITEDEYTWDSVVEEIDAVKALTSPDRPVTLVGHSFGAMFAALYASRRPDQVDQLVLVEPGGLNGDLFQRSYDTLVNIDLLDPGLNAEFWQSETLSASSQAAMDYKAIQILQNGHMTRAYCDPDHPPRYPVWRPGAHLEYLRALRMGNASYGGGRFDFDFARGLDRFPRTVLLLGGTCSALGYDFQLREHAPLFASAVVRRVENAGHRMLVERFGAVLGEMKGYLREYGDEVKR